MSDINAILDDLERMRAERDELREQVRHLKEGVGYAMLGGYRMVLSGEPLNFEAFKSGTTTQDEDDMVVCIAMLRIAGAHALRALKDDPPEDTERDIARTVIGNTGPGIGSLDPDELVAREVGILRKLSYLLAKRGRGPLVSEHEERGVEA